MTASSTLEVMKESYENGELEEYLDNMENKFFITECDWDHIHSYRAILITISGCRINTMDGTITDLDTKDVISIDHELNDAINDYGWYLSGL